MDIPAAGEEVAHGPAAIVAHILVAEDIADPDSPAVGMAGLKSPVDSLAVAGHSPAELEAALHRVAVAAGCTLAAGHRVAADHTPVDRKGPDHNFAGVAVDSDQGIAHTVAGMEHYTELLRVCSVKRLRPCCHMKSQWLQSAF